MPDYPMPDIYKHRSLPIAASAAAWNTIYAYHVCSDGTACGNGDREVEALFLQAVHLHGLRDEAAIAWVSAAITRLDHERNATGAIRGEAAAIKELADAIRGSARDTVLKSILDSLSERTRYAVKQQLGI